MANKKRPHAGLLSSRIVVTSWREGPDADVNLLRSRPKVFECWALLETYDANTWVSRMVNMDNYQANPVPIATHYATIRNPSDVLITTLFWIYTVRKFGQLQWFRINSVNIHDQYEDFLKIALQLDEIKDPRADPTVVQTPAVFEEPELLPGPRIGNY